MSGGERKNVTEQHPAPPRLTGDLVLIRHGQTPCVIINRFCGTHEAEMTPAGKRMGEYIASHRALDGIGKLISSPKLRAVRTAETIAAARGLDVEIDDRMRELHFGQWENTLPADLPDKEAHRQWEADPALYSPPGGETGLQVMARAVAAVRDAIHTHGSVAVVSHKAPIRLIICFFLGLSPSRYREIGNVFTGSVSHLRLRDGQATVRALGDVSHLPPAWQRNPDQCESDNGVPLELLADGMEVNQS
jgi:broad specificity phosphatase PhoE